MTLRRTISPSVRPMQRNLIGKLSVSQFANPTQNEFAANDRNFSVASTCELRFGSSNVPSLSCFDLREEGCCLFLNMSTFHAHSLVRVPLCQSARMYTTTQCPLARTHWCVAQAPWPNRFRIASVQKHVSLTCLTSTLTTRVFHMGSGAV